MSAAALLILLRSLGLTTMAREHDDALARAEAEHWGYPRLLRHVVETEANERLRRRVERLLNDSRLPAGKTLSSLDQARLPDKVRRQYPRCSPVSLSAAATTCYASDCPAAAIRCS